MKLNFSFCMNSVGNFLSVSTVATLLLSQPIGAIAKTSQNFAQTAVPIPLQLESLVIPLLYEAVLFSWVGAFQCNASTELLSASLQIIGIRNTSEITVEKGYTNISFESQKSKIKSQNKRRLTFIPWCKGSSWRVLHVCREGDVLLNSSKTPPFPPVPETSGGSR